MWKVCISMRPRTILLLGISVMMVIMLVLSPRPVAAQDESGWFGDDNLQLFVSIDGVNITQATETNPIVIHKEQNQTFVLALKVIGSRAIYNISGGIGFYYQGIKIFTLLIEQEVIAEVPPGVEMPPQTYEINLAQALALNAGGLGLDLATGLFQTSVDIGYYLAGDDYSGPPTHHIATEFYVLMPVEDPMQVLTSAAGVATTVATVGAVTGLGGQIWSILDGLQTAHKLRSIQKKASEIKSLPNLAVLGALPMLMTVLASIKMRRKKKTEKVSESVQEYRLKQRLREVAPAAWPMDKCPKCRRPWNKKLNMCKKCNIGEEEARQAYADLLVSKVPKAIKVLGKKKSLSVRKIAKKTKSSQYNAGVIGAAMVDVGLVEVTKVETPIRSFATNMAGLAFLIITWQQLLGGASSQWQTTLTIVGAAFSIAVIIALYLARKMQIEKIRAEGEAALLEAPIEAPAGEGAESEGGRVSEGGPTGEAPSAEEEGEAESPGQVDERVTETESTESEATEPEEEATDTSDAGESQPPEEKTPSDDE